MGGVEWQRGTAFGTSAGGSQRRGPGELADLARELTGAKAGDRRLMIEAIATDHIDRALEHEPGRGIALADVVDDFTGCEIRALARLQSASPCRSGSDRAQETIDGHES